MVIDNLGPFVDARNPNEHVLGIAGRWISLVPAAATGYATSAQILNIIVDQWVIATRSLPTFWLITDHEW